MKNKGFAFLYVFMLIIPLMMISLALADMTIMDYKTNFNVVNKTQTYYNTECGVIDALKKYKFLNYDTYRECIYYFYFSGENILFNDSRPLSKDYTRVKVSFSIWEDKKTYTIEATGYYNDCSNNITKNIVE